MGNMNESGQFTCSKCQVEHVNNITAPRIFHRLSVFAGRRGGKSLIGAHGAREEMLIPNTLGWVCGPTFKILEDATMPTLLRLIPPDWVADWKQDNLTLKIKNGSEVAFRSLDDPERGRGQGPHWAWFDEAASMVERAWDVFRPSLSENAGVAIFTTSPAGYDWCWERLWKPAMITKKPGYWACKYKTSDNPLFKQGLLKEEIEEARATMPPDLFRQEYEAEFVNFTGSIYGLMIEQQTLATAEAVRQHIPEWPAMAPGRQIIIGMDSGADHPFGAVKIVVTPTGLIVVDEYLERHQAISTHLSAILSKFKVNAHTNVKWAANRNEAQLRLEFGLRGIGVIPAENSHEIGRQRVQSWLYSKQLFFAYTAPKTIEQMSAYRFADNYGVDGQKREKEQVFKRNDELPDCVRYGMMAWPELPSCDISMSESAAQRWNALDDRTRMEIQHLREYNTRETATSLDASHEEYPLGEFYNPFEAAY